MLGLYVHIPFCKTICSYCDFNKQLCYSTSQIKEYTKALKKEIAKYKEKFIDIRTIYIGGGTPNSIPLDLLDDILTYIDNYKNNILEYTIEVNSELLTIEQIKCFLRHGINRISIGVQSFDSKVIKAIRRHHNKEIVLNAINNCNILGLNNINIDMMYGLPNQDLSSVKNDLAIIKDLDIKHISYYSLILEDKTILSYELNNKLITIPDDDLTADMSDLVINTLEYLGFERYEISNYAKPNYQSKHNLLYWNKENYIGVGMAATSYVNHIRWTNTTNISKYINASYSPLVENLSIDDEKKEFFLMGLRKITGVNLNEYYYKYKENPILKFNLEKWINKGFLEINDSYLRFTKKGIDLGNIVFEEFI